MGLKCYLLLAARKTKLSYYLMSQLLKCQPGKSSNMLFTKIIWIPTSFNKKNPKYLKSIKNIKNNISWLPASCHSYATGILVRTEGELKLWASSSDITRWHRISTPIGLLCLSSIFQNSLFPFFIVLLCFSLWLFTWHLIIIIIFRSYDKKSKSMMGHRGNMVLGITSKHTEINLSMYKDYHCIIILGFAPLPASHNSHYSCGWM